MCQRNGSQLVCFPSFASGVSILPPVPRPSVHYPQPSKRAHHSMVLATTLLPNTYGEDGRTVSPHGLGSAVVHFSAASWLSTRLVTPLTPAAHCQGVRHYFRCLISSLGIGSRMILVSALKSETQNRSNRKGCELQHIGSCIGGSRPSSKATIPWEAPAISKAGRFSPAGPRDNKVAGPVFYCQKYFFDI